MYEKVKVKCEWAYFEKNLDILSITDRNNCKMVDTYFAYKMRIERTVFWHETCLSNFSVTRQILAILIKQFHWNYSR